MSPDTMLYFIECAFKSGNAFVEVERHRMTRKQVVEDILHGQYEDVVTVIECNPVEHVCDDITEDVMAEVEALRDDDTPQLRHATQEQKWDWQRGHRGAA